MNRAMPILFDLVAVLLFALIGRLSHGLDAVGLFLTGWPFLVACLVAWGVLLFMRDPGTGLRAGIIVWFVTLAGGMGLRVASGETAAAAFIIVASIFLALVLGGWRLIFWMRRRRTA